VITGYPARAGLPLTAFVQLRCRLDHCLLKTSKASDYPEVVEVHKLSGDYCSMLKVRPGERPALLPEGLRMYDLRHTCASLLIAQGASVKAVQKQLGHKSATMTLDTYGHLWPEETERLAERMDEAHEVAVAERSRAVGGSAGVVQLRAEPTG
jgi:hypothetical protein